MKTKLNVTSVRGQRKSERRVVKDRPGTHSSKTLTRLLPSIPWSASTNQVFLSLEPSLPARRSSFGSSSVLGSSAGPPRLAGPFRTSFDPPANPVDELESPGLGTSGQEEAWVEGRRVRHRQRRRTGDELLRGRMRVRPPGAGGDDGLEGAEADGR